MTPGPRSEIVQSGEDHSSEMRTFGTTRKGSLLHEIEELGVIKSPHPTPVSSSADLLMAYLLRVGSCGFVNRLGRSGYQKQERGLQKTETLFRQQVRWSDIGEAY